jgi:high-affinity K+ transport system ATPase subunit B
LYGAAGVGWIREQIGTGGLLVRYRRGLEEARNLTAIVFDKIGNLTRGEFGLARIVSNREIEALEALRLAAAVELRLPPVDGASMVQLYVSVLHGRDQCPAPTILQAIPATTRRT